MDASDAKLIVEQEIWAATNPHAKNRALIMLMETCINVNTFGEYS